MTNEVNRILKLYTELQHGDCWVGTNFKEALQGIRAEQASKKISADTNSIWQIVSHLIYWRSKVFNRLSGNNNPPPFIDFRLRSAIHAFKDENLDKPSPKEGQTYYQLLSGCLQHDAYHLGQIVLLKKALL